MHKKAHNFFKQLFMAFNWRLQDHMTEKDLPVLQSMNSFMIGKINKYNDK
jgi:hypothetical protein